MNNEIFPEIIFRKEFSDFAKDPFVKALDLINGKNDDFRRKYNETEAENLLKYRDFRKICDALNSDGIKRFIPVKGMFVFNTIFSNHLGLRPMSDIDLLFAPDEYRKLKIFLAKHPEFPASHGEHSFLEHSREAFCVISGKTLTELHSQITTMPIRGLIKEIFENTVESTDASGRKMLVPRTEYALLIMLMHDYTAASLLNFSVRRLLEFYIVLSNSDLNKVFDIAHRFDLDRALDMQLFMIWTMLGKTFFPKNSFKIREEFGLIETNGLRFHVKHPWKIHRKLFHGKSLPLGIKNSVGAILRETKAGMKLIDILHR
ncbi:nucleotidyltransferase family protein [bacterium]|nr:nucleotidyltransferase family protein [bacterium]